MADKEEAEPTAESGPAGRSDAIEPIHPDDAAILDPTSAGPVEPETDAAGLVPGGSHAFDAIVRDSGIGGPDHSDDPPEHDPDEHDADANGTDVKALEPAGVGAAAGASTGLARERHAARQAKDAATQRRDRPVKTERTGPVKFVRESVGELRKVVYPTGQQLVNYFVVVLVFVLFVIAYVSLLDLGLGWAIFKVFS